MEYVASSFRLILAGLIAIAGVGCAQTDWTELRGLDQLTALFERDVGNTRVVLLLSPT